jgi:hypothetical protein
MIDFFKRTNDDDQREKRVLELLRGSSVVRTLEKESDAARVEQQKAESSKLKPLRDERDRELPVLVSRLKAAEEKELKALAAAKEATAQRMKAASELSSRSWWYDHQIATVVATVRNLAPACIDDCLSELGELELKARNSVRSQIGDIKLNVYSDQFTQKFSTNSKSVEHSLNAIRTAKRECEELKLQALPEAEIIERLEKLKADLPTIDPVDQVVVIPVPDAKELRRGLKENS